ncbi:MAG: ribosome maturation factor RimM [Bacteroidaceae bacterium]
MIAKEDVFEIGQITKPHGLSGEVNFTFTDDVFDRVDCNYLIIEIDGILVPFFIEAYRFRHTDSALIKFVDIDDQESAKQFTNKQVFFPKALSDGNEPQIVTWDLFIGFALYDSKLVLKGEVTDVDTSTTNTFFCIDTPTHEELLIPAHEDMIEAIDYEKRTLKMNLPEGLD